VDADDDWPWCTERPEHRTFHPGCLLVLLVCVLVWLLVMAGAVTLLHGGWTW
jgi:hypothetical protein